MLWQGAFSFKKQYRQAEIQQALPQVEQLASRYNDASTAQAFVQGYDGGLPAQIYALGFDEVYSMAQQGYSLDEIMSNPENIYSHMLMTEQARLAYEAGAAERNPLPNSGDGGRLGGENGNSGVNDFGNGAENNQEVRIKLTPATKEIKTLLENAGLNQEKIDEVVNLPKANKPEPSSYLSQEYIDNHLSLFEKGGIVKILPTEPKGRIGRKGGIFVLSEVELNAIIRYSNGDVSKIEEALGLTPGYLGDNPVIVKFNQVEGLRIPRGDELGADPHYWMPGGYTSGGIKEAVINSADEGTYTYYHLFEKEGNS